VAYQDLEQASGRLMVIDRLAALLARTRKELPVAGLGGRRGKGGAAGIAAQHCHHPTNGWPSPPSPSKRINVEQALIDSMLSGTRRDEVPAEARGGIGTDDESNVHWYRIRSHIWLRMARPRSLTARAVGRLITGWRMSPKNSGGTFCDSSPELESARLSTCPDNKGRVYLS
jgi:hypothetical protein